MKISSHFPVWTIAMDWELQSMQGRNALNMIINLYTIMKIKNSTNITEIQRDSNFVDYFRL